MTTIRYAASLLAAITLFGLHLLAQDPDNHSNPASLLLVGFFILCFGVVAWTCRERRATNER